MEMIVGQNKEGIFIYFFFKFIYLFSCKEGKARRMIYC